MKLYSRENSTIWTYVLAFLNKLGDSDPEPNETNYESKKRCSEVFPKYSEFQYHKYIWKLFKPDRAGSYSNFM